MFRGCTRETNTEPSVSCLPFSSRVFRFAWRRRERKTPGNPTTRSIPPDDGLNNLIRAPTGSVARNSTPASSSSFSSSLPTINNNPTTKKVILLGGGFQGKTTIFRQILLANQDEEARRFFREQTLLTNNNQEHLRRIIRVNIFDDLQSLVALKHVVPAIADGVDVNDIQVSPNLWNAMDNPFDAQAMSEEIIEEIERLWHLPSFQYLYRRGRHRNAVEPHSLERYVSRLREFEREPLTESDFLNIRVRTSGIISMSVKFENVNFDVYDTGGQRSERRRWRFHASIADAIIFVCDISAFNSPIWEDHSSNNLNESFEIFEALLEMNFEETRKKRNQLTSLNHRKNKARATSASATHKSSSFSSLNSHRVTSYSESATSTLNFNDAENDDDDREKDGEEDSPSPRWREPHSDDDNNNNDDAKPNRKKKRKRKSSKLASLTSLAVRASLKPSQSVAMLALQQSEVTQKSTILSETEGLSQEVFVVLNKMDSLRAKLVDDAFAFPYEEFLEPGEESEAWERYESKWKESAPNPPTMGVQEADDEREIQKAVRFVKFKFLWIWSRFWSGGGGGGGSSTTTSSAPTLSPLPAWPPLQSLDGAEDDDEGEEEEREERAEDAEEDEEDDGRVAVIPPPPRILTCCALNASDMTHLMRSVKSVLMKEDINRLLAFLAGFEVAKRESLVTIHPFFKAYHMNVLVLIREMLF